LDRPKLAGVGLLAVVAVVALALLGGRHAAQASAPGPWDHPRLADTVQRRIRAEHTRARLAQALSRVPAHSRWLASWGAAPQAASVKDPDAERGFSDQTLREITLISSAGAAVRVHLSNTYGRQPLVIGRASVAPAGADGALRGAGMSLSFAGADYVTIPAGGSVVSDPVPVSVHPLERLAVSLYLPVATGPITYHGTSAQSSFFGDGDDVESTGADWVSATSTSWYVLSGVDTLSPPRYQGAIAAMGDSITAGFRSTLNTFGAWPDDLARRLTTLPGNRLSVIDEGISGNRILNGSPCCGTSGVDRFRADVLDQAGVRDVILLEGTNDIGFAHGTSPLTVPHTQVSAAQIIAGDRRMIAAAHAAGLRIYGATLLPFRGAFYWTPAGEATRDAVNAWIRHSGAFDGVIDFAAAMAEPGRPEVLNPAYDSGDHLHPDSAGYARMADTISPAMLTGPPQHRGSATPLRRASPVQL
jgi:lysophospholipase L1-like esterase